LSLYTGPDGALWFTEPGSNQVGRITTAGKVTEYPLPTMASEPEGITGGPDGAVWFTEDATDRIGRIDPAGRLTEYSARLDRPFESSGFAGIAAGPDGALWFTERSMHAIGRITTAGAFQEFPLPSEGDPFAITAGPDGNLWFTEQSFTQVGRITPDGKVTEFGGQVLNSFYGDITAGPDGAVWFMVNDRIAGPHLGRISPDGNETFIDIPTLIPLGDITTGQDGNLWFAEMTSNQIGQWVFDAGSGFSHSSGDFAQANVNKLSPVENPGEAQPILAPTLLPNSAGSDLLPPTTIQAQSSGISHWSLIVGQPGQDNLSGEDILQAL
jgi:virginiamycin B lyase